MAPVPVVPIVLPPPNNGRLALYRVQACDAEAVGQWVDMYVRDDFFFRRRHLTEVIAREDNTVFAVLWDGLFAGIWIEYSGSVLHNLFIEPQFRGLGIGTALVNALRPVAIRAKTDMAAGDPTPFYERLGYGAPSPDPQRPHILLVHDLTGGAAARVDAEGVAEGAGIVAGGDGAAGKRPVPSDLPPGGNPPVRELPLPKEGASLPVGAADVRGAAAAGGRPVESVARAVEAGAVEAPTVRAALALSDAEAAERYRLIVIQRREKQQARKKRDKEAREIAASLSLRQLQERLTASHNGHAVHSPQGR
jgi:GNAT superfamily N-acetyltransferase